MIANFFGRIGRKEFATARFLPSYSGEMLHTQSTRSIKTVPKAKQIPSSSSPTRLLNIPDTLVDPRPLIISETSENKKAKILCKVWARHPGQPFERRKVDLEERNFHVDGTINWSNTSRRWETRRTLYCNYLKSMLIPSVAQLKAWREINQKTVGFQTEFFSFRYRMTLSRFFEIHRKTFPRDSHRVTATCKHCFPSCWRHLSVVASIQLGY